MLFLTTMIIVEFSGIPGCGKTFLSRAVASMLRTQKICVKTPLDTVNSLPFLWRAARKLFMTGIEVLTHPLRATRVFYMIIKTAQPMLHDLTRSLSTLYTVFHCMHKSRKKHGILLLDQGIIQAVFTVLYAAAKEPPDAFYSLLPVPDILVEIDSDDLEILSRLPDRPGRQSRMEHDPEQSIMHARSVMQKTRKTPLYAAVPFCTSYANSGKLLDKKVESLVKILLERSEHGHS